MRFSEDPVDGDKFFIDSWVIPEGNKRSTSFSRFNNAKRYRVRWLHMGLLFWIFYIIDLHGYSPTRFLHSIKKIFRHRIYFTSQKRRARDAADLKQKHCHFYTNEISVLFRHFTYIKSEYQKIEEKRRKKMHN